MYARRYDPETVIDEAWVEASGRELVPVADISTWDVVVSAGAEAPAVSLDIEAVLRAFDDWMRLDVADGRGSPLTLAAYRGDVKQHLTWLQKQAMMPTGANSFTMKEYRSFLIEQYQVSTVGRKLASVRRFYQMAQAHGLIPTNPTHGLKSPADKTAQCEKVKYLTLIALRDLLAATETARDQAAQIRDKCIVALMAIHGLRVCEVSRLDVEDVDLGAEEAGTLAVLGKGEKRRTVLLVDDTRVCIEKWLAVRQLMHAESAALFLALVGPAERMSTRGLRCMVDGYLKKIGAKRPGVSCHALRHTYATQSLAAGASLLAISGSLGHSSVTTTQVYAQIVEKGRSNPAKFLIGVL
jgi:site-specific recombinase XerD